MLNPGFLGYGQKFESLHLRYQSKKEMSFLFQSPGKRNATVIRQKWRDIRTKLPGDFQS